MGVTLLVGNQQAKATISLWTNITGACCWKVVDSLYTLMLVLKTKVITITQATVDIVELKEYLQNSSTQIISHENLGVVYVFARHTWESSHNTQAAK